MTDMLVFYPIFKLRLPFIHVYTVYAQCMQGFIRKVCFPTPFHAYIVIQHKTVRSVDLLACSKYGYSLQFPTKCLCIGSIKPI